MMILIFKTSGFLSPRPETEKLGFAGVLLRLTFAEVYICFDLSIYCHHFHESLLMPPQTCSEAASFISKTLLSHLRLDCFIAFFPKYGKLRRKSCPLFWSLGPSEQEAINRHSSKPNDIFHKAVTWYERLKAL